MWNNFSGVGSHHVLQRPLIQTVGVALITKNNFGTTINSFVEVVIFTKKVWYNNIYYDKNWKNIYTRVMYMYQALKYLGGGPTGPHWPPWFLLHSLMFGHYSLSLGKCLWMNLLDWKGSTNLNPRIMQVHRFLIFTEYPNVVSFGLSGLHNTKN